jgi:ABC-type phosphate/phosphonate transport system substrate-binding protein
MIASLGMYDPPPLQAANDRYWVLIRDGMRSAGLTAPDALTRGPDAYWPAWHAQDLVLSQTCGLPYRARLHDKVTLIGTPDFGLPDCPAGYYRSVLVARRDDPRTTLAQYAGGRLAYSEELSQSGWAAPCNHVAASGLRWSSFQRSGAHSASCRAVADGEADIAAIDALTWVLLCRYDPMTQRLRVIDTTTPTPGLPYIAALGMDADLMFAVIAAAIDRLSPQDRDLLHLRGIVRIPTADYLAVPNPPAPEALAAAS